MALDVENQGFGVRVVVGAGDIAQIPDLAGTEILVCIATPCGAAQMDAMPGLRGIVSPFIGFDWIDIGEATRRGIPVVNGDIRENRESMAEATIMLILALLYRLRETETLLRDPASSAVPPQRRMLKGCTIGIIGYGGIAREMVDRLRAWGAQLLVTTRRRLGPVDGARFVDLEVLLSSSDVVVIMARLDSSNHHLINRTRLQAMRPGVLLVNTSRGGLVDEKALVEALHSGHVAAAALDVFEVEPLPAEHPLRSCPNVILTPHAIGHTAEMIAAIPGATVANVLSLADGGLPNSCKNPIVADRWARAPTAPSTHHPK